MFAYIKTELAKQNIDLVSSISLNECEIVRPYLLERNGISQGTAVIFAVPYLVPQDSSKTNISAYAVSRDYHLFFESLFKTILNELEQKYPNNRFAVFTDHSPINEIKAAAKSGLGVIGKNNLLITNKYSSFVFIGEIITDAIFNTQVKDIEYCIGCNRCISACPVNMDISKCLSSITQKKGELTDDEISLIKKHGCAWGCDICQNACPYTKKAMDNGSIYTDVAFFKESRTPFLDTVTIQKMNDDDFSLRAYSWRGKKTIERNLKILEGKEN